MSDEVTYKFRPREMRDPNSKWTRDQRLRQRRHGAARDDAAHRERSIARKLIHRGLNRDTTGPALSRAIGAACAALDAKSWDAMRKLTLALETIGATSVLEQAGGPRALARLARFHNEWIRSSRTWAFTNANDLFENIGSLAQHLFARYDVPQHLRDAWMFDTPLHVAARDWYVRVARGRSLRDASGFPFVMSRAMLHYFVQGLARFSIRPALRYAQLRGVGVSDEISTVAALSPLGEVQNREARCGDVAEFLARFPEIDPADVRPMVDFALAHGAHLRFHGRTPASAMRLVTAWHQRLFAAQRQPTGPDRYWSPSGIAEFAHQIPSGRAAGDWQIVELLSSAQLRDEGAAMHHCVASYESAAADGDSAIFSLRLRGLEQNDFVRQVTIEVDLRSRRIVQARRACNERPSPNELQIIRDWSQVAQIEMRELKLL